jgi:antitoxin component YwqK of YwqJK toxin-antitoxin module
MKIIPLIRVAVLLLPSLLSAQTLVRTYHDLFKTKPFEVYYVNANGEKNGLYKAFYEVNGVLSEEATFTNGMLNGAHKLYDPTTGKAFLRQLETYKNNIKTGEAKYFSGDGYVILQAHGSYLNGKRSGVWTFIEPIQGEVTTGDMHFRFSQTFKDGELVSEDSKTYFYPSGKLYSEEVNKNEKLSELKFYFPSGKLHAHDFYDEGESPNMQIVYFEDGSKEIERIHSSENGEKVEMTTVWYHGGQTKEVKKIVNNNREVLYEGYNDDGSKNEKMLSGERDKKEKEAFNKRLQAEEKQRLESEVKSYNEHISHGNSLYESGSFEKSINSYKKAIGIGENNLNTPQDSATVGFFTEANKKASEKVKEIEAIIELRGKIEQQSEKISGKYDKFLSLYAAESEAIRNTRGPNALLPHNHENGKFVFEKGNALYEEYMTARKRDKDLNGSLRAGDEALKLLERLISLASTDTKDVNKQLKKASTSEEAKQILGLQ